MGEVAMEGQLEGQRQEAGAALLTDAGSGLGPAEEAEGDPEWGDLLTASAGGRVQDLVRASLAEDVPSFDVGGYVVGSTVRTARLLFKAPQGGVLAGMPFVEEAFAAAGGECELVLEAGVCEGMEITAAQVEAASGKLCLATVRGPACQLLLAERTALNFLSRASGIATEARRAVRLAQKHGWHGLVAGTRKTTPGFRLVEKYALTVGGAATHRHDLSQMVMLKDNHIWSLGSITKAVQRARRAAGFSIKIEVECSTVDDAMEAADAGADVVMLDNFQPGDLHEAAQTVKERFPHVLIEASGGITEETLPQFFGPHIDVISRGNLTQGYACLDFSLKIQPPTKVGCR